MITLITPTGTRPEAFALCEKYMARQTVKYDKWIVVDDGEVPTKCTLGQDYYRISTPWKQGDNSQAYLMRTALSKLGRGSAEYVHIIEDDDWYDRQYLEYMRLFQNFELVGECNARYYNLTHRCYKWMNNCNHASLCQTMISADKIPTLLEVLNTGVKFFDIELWNRAKTDPEIGAFLFTIKRPLCIGIKGMPGRGGIGVGSNPVGYKADGNLRQLKEWIGEEDAKAYEKYIGR